MKCDFCADIGCYEHTKSMPEFGEFHQRLGLISSIRQVSISSAGPGMGTEGCRGAHIGAELAGINSTCHSCRVAVMSLIPKHQMNSSYIMSSHFHIFS